MIEWPTLIALLLSFSVAAYSVYRDRNRIPIATREEQLTKQVAAMDATIQTLLADRAAAQRQIDDFRTQLADANARIASLQAQLSRYTDPIVIPTSVKASPKILVAVIGEDEALQIDMAALRKAAERPELGVRITQVPASMTGLQRLLDRYRKTGKPLKWIHYSGHASPQGLAFNDGLATARWLSEHLRGVEILLINGCEADAVGDWIGVVPTVISMRDKIEHEDAANFCQVFWQGVVEGLNGEEAFDQALLRCPPNVAEFAELHV